MDLDRTFGKLRTWLLLAGAGIVGLVATGVIHDPEDDGRLPNGNPAPPPVEAPQNQGEGSAEEPGARGTADPRTVDALLSFLIDEGPYPAEGVDFAEVPIPPNGPSEVSGIIGNTQEMNQAAVPEADPALVDSVTSCTGVQPWKNETDWDRITGYLREGLYADADSACQGAAAELAASGDGGATIYLNFPKF